MTLPLPPASQSVPPDAGPGAAPDAAGQVRSAPARGSLLQAVRAVAWAFLGIRRSAESQQDMVRIHPLHVVVVALAAAGVFVAGLVGLVHWIV